MEPFGEYDKNRGMQSQKDTFEVRPIAYLNSVFDHKFGTPRQGMLAPHGEAWLQLDPLWRNKGMLEGLEGISHVWLISLFHQNKNRRVPSKIHPPRLLGESVGVLASRSPHHPNSLGLTLAKVNRVEGDSLWISGIDLVDGTPILDIKPYLADADRPTEFSGGWTDQLPETAVACVFSQEALNQLDQLVVRRKIVNQQKFMALVQEVLALDPRPLSYRQRTNERFAIVLGGMDVHARYNENQFTVLSIQPFEANADEPQDPSEP